MKTIETEVLIIGGGVTGTGIFRDLALRGIKSILLDKKDLCSGASGGNHGLLHSGARYVSNDLHSAIECQIEGNILKKIAPHCIENTGGLFASVKGDDEAFGHQFPALCNKAGIECTPVSIEEALIMEPLLSKDLQQVFYVPDATIDPFRLALENVAHGESLNDSSYLAQTELIEFTIQDGVITEGICQNSRTGEKIKVIAQQYVNAGGGWAMEIAEKAGCTDVHLLWSKGTLLISHDRLTKRVINRLRPPSDGDILVPGGTVSVLGTTSIRADAIENVRPTIEEVNKNLQEGSALIPAIEDSRFIRAFSRVRPLVLQKSSSDDRDVARSFSLFEHSDCTTNFCTITGGKLTTFRLMAEKTADLVAKRLGNTSRCTSHEQSLPGVESSKWTEPAASPKLWYRKNDPDDMILCECEMVPQSAITEIIADSPGKEANMTLEDIALRSRAGKGPCQGSFCGIRITSHLYEKGHYTDEKGLHDMRDFFKERFKGMRSVIWGQQMAQMELAEALHSGLMGLEQVGKNDDTPETE